MADHARAKGLSTECLDAFEYLDKQPDGSIGSVFSAQFIEHLPGERLISLIRLSHRKPAPGGGGVLGGTVHFPLGSGDLDADLPTQGEYALVARKTT